MLICCHWLNNDWPLTMSFEDKITKYTQTHACVSTSVYHRSDKNTRWIYKKRCKAEVEQTKKIIVFKYLFNDIKYSNIKIWRDIRQWYVWLTLVTGQRKFGQ